MNRWINFAFGLIAYAFGLGSLVLFMIFVGGWDFLPWQIDASPSASFGRAVFINIGLITLFGLQHSIMARPSFKQIWTRIIPTAVERSWYCVATGVVICLICFFWEPLPGVVWNVDHSGLVYALLGLQLIGWTTVIASSFMINHFELFGLQQVYYPLVDQRPPKPSFTVRYLYRFVRHPLQMGMLIGIWATPHMSTSHMFLSASMSIYITIGLYLEERDLATFLGQDYENYRRQVPMIVPNLRAIPANLSTPELSGTDSAFR